MNTTARPSRSSARTLAITSESIGATMVRLTAPMTVGIISLMLLGLVDAYFVGQLGTAQLAALAFTLPVTHGVNSIGLGIGMGLSVLVSRLLGEDKFQRAARLVTDSRLLVLTTGIALATGLYLGLSPLFLVMGADAQTLPYILDFMVLWLPVLPLLLLTLTGNTILRAVGSPTKSAICLAVVAVLNGVLDPLLIFGVGPFPGMGIAGASLATVIAWMITYGLSDYMLSAQEGLILRGKSRWSHTIANWKALLTIGIPAILANFTTPFAAAVLTAMVAKFGAEAVAGFGVCTRVEALALLVAFALSSTLPMFIGQNIGAGKHQRAQRALFGSLKFILVFQIGAYLLLVMLAGKIATAFSDNPAVTEIIRDYLWIVPLTYGAHAVVILVMVSLNVLHRPQTALLTTLLRLLVLNLPLAYIGGQWGGPPGLFAGFALGNLISGLLAWRIITRVWRETLSATAPAHP